MQALAPPTPEVGGARNLQRFVMDANIEQGPNFVIDNDSQLFFHVQ